MLALKLLQFVGEVLCFIDDFTQRRAKLLTQLTNLGDQSDHGFVKSFENQVGPPG
jgi:hypothetical protein